MKSNTFTRAPQRTTRDFYKGSSFRYCGQWETHHHYMNDEYYQDFTTLHGVLLACKKEHLSNVEPEFKYDDQGKIIALLSDYWEIAAYLSGEKGAKGDKGDKGDQGIQGVRGPQGEVGPQGPTGPTGIAPVLRLLDGWWWISYDNGETWEKIGEYVQYRGIPVYTDSMINEIGEENMVEDYISIPDQTEVTRTDQAGTPYIQMLFSAIRSLQAEITKLKNSFNLGINSCNDKETASARIMYDLDDVEEEEPLWAVQESELSSLFSLQFTSQTELKKATPSTDIIVAPDNSYLEIAGKAYWRPSDEGIDLPNSPDAKFLFYVTTNKKTVDFTFNMSDGSQILPYTVHLNELLQEAVTDSRTYATLVVVSRKITDALSEEKYGKNFIWITVQDLVNNDTILEKYLNPVTGYTYDNPYYLDDEFWFGEIALNNTKVSKFDLYSKYQDFSDYVDPIRPSDINEIKYKAAHITIRSVDSVATLDSLLKKLQSNELVYVTSSNNLYIVIDGVKHKIGSSDEPTPIDTMTVKELIENLAAQGLINLKGAEYDDEGNLIAVDDISLAKIASLAFVNESTGDEITYSVDSEGNLVGYTSTPENYKFSYLIGGDYSKGNPIVNVEGTLNNLASTEMTATRGFIARIHGDNVSGNSKDQGLKTDRVKIGAYYSPRSDDKVFGCSHAYIELENSSQSDYYLDGCYLHFAGPIVGQDQYGNKVYTQATYHVALAGKLPAGGTYLIRGKQYEDMDNPTTYIKVKTFDTEWYVTPDTVTFTPETGYTYNLSGLIDLTYQADAPGIIYGFALTYGQPRITYNTTLIDPAHTDDTDDFLYVRSYLIDSCNMFISAVKDAYWNGLKKSTTLNVIKINPGNCIFKNTFELDPAKQAFQALSKKDSSRLRGVTAADYQMVELSKEYIQFPNSNDVMPVAMYTPKASFEHKNVSTDKSKLDTERPNMPTVSYGIDHTRTRCFNWVSVGDYDEYVWIRPKGTSSWARFQSYWGDSVDSSVLFSRKEFNYPISYELNGQTYETTVRKVVYANDKLKNVFPGCNTPYTSHKCIITINATPENPTEYEYVVGRSNSDKTPMEGHVSDILSFTVYPNTYTPVIYQVSDQQGFHWIEYQAWAAAANAIKEKIDADKLQNPNIIPIILNTGDMTQNGTRINEWLDYYNAGRVLFDTMEQMNLVGNNDLGNIDEKALGTGDDPGKSNPHFFDVCNCSEIPLLVSTNSDSGEQEVYCPIYTGLNGIHFIPSMYYCDIKDFRIFMGNSEITGTAGTELFGTGNYDIYTGYLWKFDNNNTSDVTTEYKNILPVSMNLDGVLYNNSNHYLYEVFYKWFMNAKTSSKKVIFACHEMPFTVITQDNIKKTEAYSDRSISTTGSSTGLIGSHVNRNNFIKSSASYLKGDMKIRNIGTYWLSRLLENFNIKYCIGGHKHTYACTWPIRENYYYKENGTWYNSLVDGKMTMPETLKYDTVNFLVDGNIPVIASTGNDTIGSGTSTYKNLTKFPIAAAKNFTGDVIHGGYSGGGDDFETLITKDTRKDQSYVVYFMLQATGFKLKSNKELPGTLQKFSQIIPETNVAQSKPGLNQIYPMFARIDLDSSKYDSGLDFRLMAIKNIVPNNATDVFNQQTTKPNGSYPYCAAKPVVYYFNNKTSVSDNLNIPYGAEGGTACWETIDRTLNLNI